MTSTVDSIFAGANYVQHGHGRPVILLHGIAASLHDWDDLIPALTQNGYESYALDLLGHGDSPKPNSRAYHIDWLNEHFSTWVKSLSLTDSVILVGHSLGGYVALEHARRFGDRIRGLVLVDPFYSRCQLPPLLRRTYGRPHLRSFIIERTPEWMFRLIVDFTSVAMGHSSGAMHSLPERIRQQTAMDYARTAPGVYHIPNEISDATGWLPHNKVPTLVVWGKRDRTLAPVSFSKMVEMMPSAIGRSIDSGHVPHQSNSEEFNEVVLNFLKRLDQHD